MASSSPAAGGGAADARDPLEGGAASDQQLTIAWLDAVVKGINMLPGAKDSLLLVALLTAVRSHHCYTDNLTTVCCQPGMKATLHIES